MQSSHDRIQYYEIGQERKRSILAKLKRRFEQNKQIKQAWVFGYVSRRNSVRDVDVAILAEPPLAFDEFLNLNVQIELELRVPVDLEIAQTPVSLKDNILSNGIPIKKTK
jgi:predicted nucleotidyltransferase